MRIAIAAAAAMIAGAVHAAPPSKLYVFGDSLIDAGNVWVGSGFQVPAASQGYFQGRFHNGPAWTDIINQRLTGSYTSPFLLGGNNYAVGGARAAGNAIVPAPGGGTAVLPGGPAQAQWYIGQNGLTIDPTALYVISFGNNDATAIRTGQTYLDGPNGTIVPVDAAAYTQAFVTNIVSTAAFALNGGARVLIGGVPKPDDDISIALNNALNAGLNPLTAAYGNRLIRYDYASVFTAMRNDPVAFGLAANTNFGTGPTDDCLSNRTAVNGVIGCSGYFSFDGTHPTKQIHQALARDIAPLIGLAAVPEPGTWAMMIIGFGAVGLATRRRRPVAA